MTSSIFLQSVLDGLLLALSSLGLLGRFRGKLDRLLPLLFVGICLPAWGLGITIPKWHMPCSLWIISSHFCFFSSACCC